MSDDGTGSERKRLRLDDAAYFVYTGQEDVPWDVICVLIHPSVRVIRGEAFNGRMRLLSVEFHDRLEVIEESAFEWCRSLVRIFIPPSVRVIKDWAFSGCSGLTTVILGDGLEEIGVGAFFSTSLVQIDIPPTVRAIKHYTFDHCSKLTTVILGNGKIARI